MGFAANIPNDDSRVASMGSMAPITELTPDGSFSGSWQALYKGASGGAAAVGRTVGDALTAGAMAQGVAEMAQNPFADQSMVDQMRTTPTPPMPFSDSLQRVQDWAKLDPRVQGPGAQVLGSTVHGVTVFGLGTLAGGPLAGAGTLAATEGYNDYRESIAAGVDPKTAAEKAGLTGAFAGLGAFLPFKFGGVGFKGLLASTGGGAAVNTGFGVATRFLTSELLEHAGYSDMAKQYQPLDTQSMMADLVLGMAFGGFAHLTHGSDVPAAQRPDPATVSAALDARRNEMVGRGAAGLPTDPVHANLDARLQDEALGNMLRGKPADVAAPDADAIVHNALIDPERVALNQAYDDAGRAVHGDMADFSEPVRPAAQVPPFEPVEPTAPKPAAAAGETSALSPTATESLRQLAARHPDLEVTMPDGRTVKAANFEEALNTDMQNATRDSKLHDVAVACFLRTL